MNLVACGINHETAPLSLREQLSFSSDYLAGSLQELLKETQAEEVMILSTCNRTEFYCINGQAQHTLDWLYRTKQVSKANLQNHWYVYHEENAVRHILRVASGLDSIILGEPQITGQLKTAFSFAHSLGIAGNQFKRLFQYIFSVSKQVRHQTAISAHPVSLAFSLVSSAKCIFANLADARVLLIGAGETTALVAKHLLAQGIQHFLIANRTAQHAKRLALMVGGKTIALIEISYYLPEVDLVVTATTSPLPIVGKGMLESALKKRRRRPLFMADLGMPRDIEAEVNQLEDVYLYTLNDLQKMIQKNQSHRKVEAIKAEALIENKLQEYLELLRLKEVAPIIRAYREQAEQWRDQELKKAFSLLEKGLSAEEVMQGLAYRLTNQLLHVPSVALRQAATLNQQDILASIIKLFDLNQS
ncbi:glutamyl-tRNA reductase [Candidatus Rickettsiella viridis]|uniref:Glutamyl-tRNA reductase n=1 Tax=Candidatus Rickettsiella viridis TaxID=676208 RepID=A0A2Z5UUU8_9COXI|nr:glutamyl-tRNA reductase [Candidatus Rickettsiella viridis]BBB15426.1 glutamyl-tRNA reductase [Candidatus Rickettsiella viridis]